MNEDDSFARTYPDIRKLRAQDQSQDELIRLMTEFSKAGMKLEARMEKIELRHATEDGEQKGRGQVYALIQWVIGIGIALGAFFIGHNVK